MSQTIYTIVLDYKGGTYISQVSGESPEVALAKWANTATESDLATWRLSRPELARLLQGRLVPLENCLNVWSASDSTKAGLMLVNIIATQSP